MKKWTYPTLIAVILLVGCMPSNVSPTQSPTLVLSPTPTQTIEPEPTPTGTPTPIVESKSFVEQIQTEFIKLQEMKTEYSNQFSSIPMNINFLVSPTASNDYAWRSLDDLEATKPNKFGDDPAQSVARALMHGFNQAWKKAGNAADLTTEISRSHLKNGFEER